ncbi:Peptidoglycan/LPS O-acetylase OafA/YrhL, contains acyltransferase and SGNH-hydrolase domains [Pseudobutyrivibrio ruminis]|uniref:Peptidoglycan/LPS O-acetylase OafA/YrhL, contains acyltransferase and SGNH-hydrolase domains n=1 Tax=Pseudobutyrivibrio ruminis TaxID=46206 RepID=A0A1H7H6X6_9FIRM|nr:acyltransferase family protein [Pseudobutyrivibrio ruminis]SEK45988.1 Peptidoglycan/LPS O-acetylase OafA/YrhL, contains acyltransferase and SGNH-hydrolase domains [Pseudobutyrivibrio ruminis]
MTDRFDYIDAIKGWAILGVIMVHSGLWGTGKAATFAGSGASMCQMFFLVSSFLIYGSYDRFVKKHNYNYKAKDVLSWELKKIVRLIPLWYLSLIVHLLAKGYNLYWLGSQGKVSVWNILTHILFIHGFNPYYIDSMLGVDWYVGDIAILIFLSPLIYMLIKSVSQSLMWIIIINIILKMVVPYAQIITVLPVEDSYIWEAFVTNFGIWNQLPVILMGICLYKIMSAIDTEKITIIKQKKLLSYVIMIISIIVQYDLIFRENKYCFTNITLWGVAYVMWFTSQKIYPISILNNPLVKVLGKYSYAIYLFHFGIFIRYYEYLGIHVADERLNALLKILIVTTGALVMGIIVTRYIEKPIVSHLNLVIDNRLSRI